MPGSPVETAAGAALAANLTKSRLKPLLQPRPTAQPVLVIRPAALTAPVLHQ